MNNANRIRVVAGHALNQTPPEAMHDPQARCVLVGKNGWFGLPEGVFSKHILVLGAIGSGKTNLIFQIIEQVQSSLRRDEVLIIFDTKGDFLAEFQNEKSIVISNDDKACGLNGPDYWNIFREIMFRNETPYAKNVLENAMNIATSLFADKIKKTSQVFFPQAARDLLAAVLVCMLREMYKFSKEPQKYLNNAVLRGFLDRVSGHELNLLLGQYDDMANVRSYISIPDSPQTQGVLSELQQGLREFFIGNYSNAGQLSMRELVHNKGGTTIFIEYDIAYGNTLAPIFRLLIDLALEEAMGRNRSPGNVWVFIDEFSLLPNLARLENALNFGRSLGLKLVLGLQNFNQLLCAYPEEAKGRSIASGCTTGFIFRLVDPRTIEYAQGWFGKNRRLEDYINLDIMSNSPGGRINDGNVVEDWNLRELPVGACIAYVPGYAPFLFASDMYDRASLREKLNHIRTAGNNIAPVPVANGIVHESPFASLFN